MPNREVKRANGGCVCEERDGLVMLMKVVFGEGGLVNEAAYG